MAVAKEKIAFIARNIILSLTSRLNERILWFVVCYPQEKRRFQMLLDLVLTDPPAERHHSPAHRLQTRQRDHGAAAAGPRGSNRRQDQGPSHDLQLVSCNILSLWLSSNSPTGSLFRKLYSSHLCCESLVGMD